MVRPERFELPTPWFVARYSIQLSYGRVDAELYLKIPSGMAERGRSRASRAPRHSYVPVQQDSHPPGSNLFRAIFREGGSENPFPEDGGERGIRTLDTLLAYTPLAGVRLRPLGHLS